jgi:predicted RNA-binding protein with PIN domain
LDIDMPYWFDGNNLIGQSTSAAREDSQTRRAFLASLSSYHQSGGGRFLVYFDGDDPGRTAAPPGVSVRFSAPLSTDEVFIRRLREIQRPAEVIVVTNDSELMRRCRDLGAAAMNWRQFASRMQSRSAPSSTHKHSQEYVDVDVEDWLRYFGLHKSNG